MVSEASVDLDSQESYDLEQAAEDELEILTNEQNDFYMKQITSLQKSSKISAQDKESLDKIMREYEKTKAGLIEAIEA